jgi:structural maintenance of chromosome 4
MQQGFPGVLGRLGDLGDVPKDYEEIITTCCSRLDNIVVTDHPSAEQVLNFLKVRKLGRTTCIILDKIGEYRTYMNRPF